MHAVTRSARATVTPSTTSAVRIAEQAASVVHRPALRVCLDDVRARYGFRTYIDGAWYRCCGGHVRKLVDCCAYSRRRINGDASLTGYCYAGRRVFCVQYYDTRIPC